MRDREINIMDIVARILLGWRVILVLMLVGGILMGGLSYAHSYRTQQAQLAEQLAWQAQLNQNDEEYYRKNLTEVQLYNIYTVLENERAADIQELYLQESVKMQIDALNVPRVELVYCVDAEDLATACQIGQIYKDVISSGLGKWLAEGGEISSSVMSELFEMGSDGGNVVALNERSSFSIVIFHASEEQCLELAEKAEKFVQDQSARLVRELGDYEVQLVSQNFSFVIDLPLRERQQSVRNSILSLRFGCAKTKAGFAEEEWQYYNYMTQDNETEVNSASDADGVMVVQPSIELIYVLLGMFIFAFLYVIYIFVIHVLNEKVQITDDINAIYGVHELGTIPSANKKKKVMAFVDDWIYKLFAWNKRRFSPEKAIGLSAAAVNMAVQKEGLQEVYCVGCDMQNDALSIADMIENTLKKENISMKVLNDILYNQESMEQILSAKGAFLLEKAGGTLYDEIDRELKLLQRQDIKVLGVIIME